MMHENTRIRIRRVCEITQMHYEEGSHSSCYKAVWRNHIYPIYPMSYRTYLNYISTSGVMNGGRLNSRKLTKCQ